MEGDQGGVLLSGNLSGLFSVDRPIAISGRGTIWPSAGDSSVFDVALRSVIPLCTQGVVGSSPIRSTVLLSSARRLPRQHLRCLPSPVRASVQTLFTRAVPRTIRRTCHATPAGRVHLGLRRRGIPGDARIPIVGEIDRRGMLQSYRIGFRGRWRVEA